MADSSAKKHRPKAEMVSGWSVKKDGAASSRPVSLSELKRPILYGLPFRKEHFGLVLFPIKMPWPFISGSGFQCPECGDIIKATRMNMHLPCQNCGYPPVVEIYFDLQMIAGGFRFHKAYEAGDKQALFRYIRKAKILAFRHGWVVDAAEQLMWKDPAEYERLIKCLTAKQPGQPRKNLVRDLQIFKRYKERQRQTPNPSLHQLAEDFGLSRTYVTEIINREKKIDTYLRDVIKYSPQQ